MFKALFGQKTSHDHAHALYGAVVARARSPFLFAQYGVPDTFDGRLEMMVLHLYLITERLQNSGDEQARALAQEVFDNFIDDMDQGLREAGVGDQTVPKRIGKMTRVFYGHAKALDEARQTVDAAQLPSTLTKFIASNILGMEENFEGCNALAGYLNDEIAALKAVPLEQLLAGKGLFENTSLAGQA